VVEEWRTHFKTTRHAGDVQLREERVGQWIGVVPVQDALERRHLAGPELRDVRAQEVVALATEQVGPDVSPQGTAEKFA
jgi:hypothetical protein